MPTKKKKKTKTDPKKYAAYKKAGGKLTSTQAAGISYRTPAESKKRMASGKAPVQGTRKSRTKKK